MIRGCLLTSLRSISIFTRLLKKQDDYSKCGLGPAALVLGVYSKDDDMLGQQAELTPTGTKMNERLNGRIMEILRDGAKPIPKNGQARILFDLDLQYPLIVVSGLGDICQGYNPDEQIDERKESIRIAAAVGCQAVQDYALLYIHVDTMGHAESAAEGASLGTWLYQDLRDGLHHKRIPKLECLDSSDYAGWSIGLHKAAAQNLARLLTETPANHLTPSLFTQTTVEVLSKCGINVNVRMKHWAKLRNLNAFLAVAQGSCEEPVFMEALYEGCDPDICPAILIGKGVTFDAGGLCMKSFKEMEHTRGDMTGAAVVIATLRAIAALQLPINVRGLIPLCENLPGAKAIHPGSIVRNVADKSILIRNTDDEGVLMLADALAYANEFSPKLIVDVGNFTKQATNAMGSAASVVFSNSDSLYETLRIASIHTGDKVWRFPLWKYFDDYVKSPIQADIRNLLSHNEGGGVCKAASFLGQFLKNDVDWMHIDTDGIYLTSGKTHAYLREGMSGRPTRTLIEFFAQLACMNQTEPTTTSKCQSKH